MIQKEPKIIIWGGLGLPLGGVWDGVGPLGGALGSSWGALGVLLRCFWVLLEAKINSKTPFGWILGRFGKVGGRFGETLKGNFKGFGAEC